MTNEQDKVAAMTLWNKLNAGILPGKDGRDLSSEQNTKEYQEDIETIAAALAARERAVWLEAAERLEDDCYGGPTVDHDFLGHDDLGNERFKHNTNQVRIAKEFRQQAEG